MSWTGIPELREGHRQLGPLRFWSLMIGTVTFIIGWAAIDMWLAGKIGWPERYGFHCHSKCLIENLWHSPSLLKTHSVYELGFFASIWFMPAVLIGIFIYALMKKRPKLTIFETDSTE